eukprot:TRINITY_DN2077_c0_g1_i1.p2 TRINITY_DN2077_c0_g1~~TRINITY_DN2077_c0_g1_i1.p2  ORF type:complete len:105 (-),score=21.14 TRINITY_DN2077_c0_g1_i1:104-418(-)
MNVILPKGCGNIDYEAGLTRVLDRVEAFNPEAIVVSFGIDTYIDDPFAEFKITTDGYNMIGGLLGRRNKNVQRWIVVQEGGYLVEKLGLNCVTFLDALKSALEI